MADGVVEQAATAVQGMMPGIAQSERMTTFGPTPIVQPPPIPQYQPQKPEYGNSGMGTHFETVGARKRADKQALFNNIANIVKSGTDYIQARKTRALSLDIQRLMEATQGVQEAKDILQQDPNDPKAKEALERNTGIINDITADPKKSKQLQKAFNIDLFGSGKNKQENMALMDAWKQYNTKQQAGDKTALNPTAQRFMASQPIRQQLTPEAQAQAQMIKAGLAPNSGEIIKSQTELIKAFTAAKSVEERNSILEKNAALRASTDNARTQALIDNNNARILGMQEAQKIAARSKDIISQRVANTWDKRLSMLEKIASDKNTTEKDKVIVGSINKEATTLTNQLKVYMTDNEKLLETLNKQGTTVAGIKWPAMSKEDQTLTRIKIGANKAAMEQVQKQLKNVETKTQMMQNMGILSLGNDSSSSVDDGDTGGTQDDPLPPPPEENE